MSMCWVPWWLMVRWESIDRLFEVGVKAISEKEYRSYALMNRVMPNAAV